MVSIFHWAGHFDCKLYITSREDIIGATVLWRVTDCHRPQKRVMYSSPVVVIAPDAEMLVSRFVHCRPPLTCARNQCPSLLTCAEWSLGHIDPYTSSRSACSFIDLSVECQASRNSPECFVLACAMILTFSNSNV